MALATNSNPAPSIIGEESPGENLSGCMSASGLLEFLKDGSSLFIVRIPSEALSDGVSLTRATEAALRGLLPEPHDLAIASLDSRAVAVTVSPRTGEPLDPVHALALIGSFRRRIAAELRIEPTCLEVLPLTCTRSVETLGQNLAALNELLETIVQKRLRVQFQPIVDLVMGRVHGYEALIRLPQDGTLTRPGELFRMADGARLVSWVDIAYQEKCFEGAVRAGLREYLFVNMDAEGLAHLELADQSLADRASECGIDPRRIVMELTERQAIHDFPRLAAYIDTLRSQGFRIAIDDAGAGYSSLSAIANLRPDFLKVERALTRGLHNSGTRRALIESLARFGERIGAELIVEGIETADELGAVIDAGVRYGQGYLLGRPNDDFRGVRRSVRDQLSEQYKRRSARNRSRSYAIEHITQRGVAFTPDSTLGAIAKKFQRDPDLECAVICLDGRVEGVVTPAVLASAVQRGVGAESPASLWMDPNPVLMDAATAVEEACNRAAYHMGRAGHATFVVVRGREFVGVLPARELLRAVSTLCASLHALRSAA